MAIRPKLAPLAMLLPAAALAQEDFERFRLELTASAWLINTSGTIQSGITPIDLQRDLAIEQWQPRFFGKLALKPARRHRLLVEGVPYRLNGAAMVTRQITFAGHTYRVNDFVVSAASIDYVAGAYQFDFVSRPRGHLGALVGVASVNANGSLSLRNSRFTATERQSFPFPQAGAEGRAFLLPHRGLIEIDGELKGMAAASYGHFLQFATHGGVSIGRHLTLQAGYLLMTADVHRQDKSRGFNPAFRGPIFGIQVRDR